MHPWTLQRWLPTQTSTMSSEPLVALEHAYTHMHRHTRAMSDSNCDSLLPTETTAGVDVPSCGSIFFHAVACQHGVKKRLHARNVIQT
jgi:hypothetical protein